jgi:DoxX-like family
MASTGCLIARKKQTNKNLIFKFVINKKMKKTRILYWIFTGLFSAFMIFSAVPDAISTADAVKFMNSLGYPNYIIPFLGIAKLLGVIAILIPGFRGIKEWAYAGLFFDLVGATYSVIATNGFQPAVLIMVLPITFLFISYYLWHKKMKTV